jgi:hypothetical protein
VAIGRFAVLARPPSWIQERDSKTDPLTYKGAAIFHGKISKLLPEMVTAAALSNGLPKTSVKDLIVALSNQDEQALAKIPGLTPQIIGAAVVALKKAYLKSFHAVWYPAIAFAVIGLICEWRSVLSFTVRVAAADQSSTGSLAYHNPAKDLNNRIDAPVESEEALYGVSGPAEKTWTEQSCQKLDWKRQGNQTKA